ncbi:MAG: murein hydrolase activator EnvC [Velocimicrobium sp.]
MKKKCVLGILVVCGFLLLTGGVFIVKASSITDAESAKKQLEQQKKQTEAQIAGLKDEKGDLLTYIEKLDKQVAEIDTQISDTNQKIKKTNKKIKTNKEELEVAKQEEQKQYDAMKLRIKYMYENGSEDYVELLLEAESISDLLNRAEYISKISAYDKNLLQEHKEMKEAIAKKEKKLESQASKLLVLQEQLTYEQTTITKLCDDKNKELKKYNADIVDASKEAQKYAEEIEKQENVIEDLLEKERKRIEEEERKKREAEAAANNKTTTDSNYDANTSSDFRWPLNIAGTITSKFGYRKQPTAGASTYHKGIDISAPSGTQIVAAAAGKVVTATYSSSAGNYIMIYHGNSTYTVYMHCSSLSVSVNDEVAKGQAIAAVGSTGISTGSHLHFGISVNGSYVDPLNYVSQ